jgi:hypothetical protein
MTNPSGMTAAFGYGEGGERMTAISRRASRREARKLAGGQARPGRAGRRHRKAAEWMSDFRFPRRAPKAARGESPKSSNPPNLPNPRHDCPCFNRPSGGLSETRQPNGPEAVMQFLLRLFGGIIPRAASGARDESMRRCPVAAAYPSGLAWPPANLPASLREGPDRSPPDLGDNFYFNT